MSADDRTRCARVEGRADLTFVDAVLDALEKLWDEAPDVADEDRMLFTLAVSEIVTNVATHAPGAPDLVTSAELEVSEEMLRAVIKDTAAPVQIDWSTVGMPGDEAESGRGLALAQATLDRLEHRSDEDGNIWLLIRRGGVTRS
ncbi:ATP-binding protein [Microbacterium oryzae]|uniref:ATP-binding protein n=1 Tax=Microbacterium oryzae TaxID=743009 RepID=UPI0025AEF46C|nr:ATP-binding protein [Microbacterium oryzae]MDN3312087.1 ATP-binding protein [Microbacterium oryzae]